MAADASADWACALHHAALPGELGRRREAYYLRCLRGHGLLGGLLHPFLAAHGRDSCAQMGHVGHGQAARAHPARVRGRQPDQPGDWAGRPLLPVERADLARLVQRLGGDRGDHRPGLRHLRADGAPPHLPQEQRSSHFPDHQRNRRRVDECGIHECRQVAHRPREPQGIFGVPEPFASEDGGVQIRELLRVVVLHRFLQGQADAVHHADEVRLWRRLLEGSGLPAGDFHVRAIDAPELAGVGAPVALCQDPRVPGEALLQHVSLLLHGVDRHAGPLPSGEAEQEGGLRRVRRHGRGPHPLRVHHAVRRGLPMGARGGAAQQRAGVFLGPEEARVAVPQAVPGAGGEQRALGHRL
mmetsp:Transcript_105024/g.321848  ORF Transcript_105024/g.321848 Transcript_105024/m.321848 type:complete len:355 (-) Transcript_105024:415-1479(-)